MSNHIYEELAWLPRAPDDFSARCKQLAKDPNSIGNAVRQLALSALDENQLTRLARVLDARRAAGGGLEPLQPYRLGILSNATTEFLIPPLIGTAARYGIALECVENSFGQVVQTALDVKSSLYKQPLDAVLVAIDYRGLPLSIAPGDRDAASQSVAAALEQIETVRAAVHQHAGVPCFLSTLARPVESCFGSLDLSMAGTARQLIDAFNHALAKRLDGTPDLLLDVSGCAEAVGLADWHDPMLWNLGKIPFANRFLPLYADLVCRLIAAQRGKSRRCLILDLDNTLWGGVIGDDGLEGIAIAQGDATGEAFLSVQRAALALRGRGIVLAVSSKNNDETARMPFQKHPEMLLQEKHFAVFQANWNDKATNIKTIADELSLGLESMVFLDDNPVERGLVRKLLPEVAIPELPDDPALYARTLLASGYFEAITFSKEDRERAEFYQNNAKRLALQEQAGDVEGYLRSLDMTIFFSPFDALGRSRITQLINKSNQFNLTTRRYTEAAVAQLETDPSVFTLQVRLKDSFGDNGMISVIICRSDGSEWQIDTWLMSCRVLGRGVEQAVLNEIVLHARDMKVARLVGSYIPTERNELVQDHYAKLGFTPLDALADGTTTWSLPIEAYKLVELPIAVKRHLEEVA